MPQTKFTDFWELLSDGRLSKKTKEDLDYYLYNYMNNKKNNEKLKAKGEETTTAMLGIWDAKTLNASLGLNMNVSDMAEMGEEEMIELIIQAKKKKKIYEPVNHCKTLVIISGNLDEAFQMAQATSEADIDADIYHAFTKKLTVVDIKNALTRKFRPEQVARFGNIHLIYNSLRRADFEALIAKEIARVIRETESKIGLSLSVGKNINELIYNN